jgi:glycosyltransferase involved in cell wall biosynthesis
MGWIYMKKFKIAISINYLAIGGTQTFALSLAQGLAAIGHTVFVYDFNLPFYTTSIKDLNSPLLNSSLYTFVQFQLPNFPFYRKITCNKILEPFLTWIINKKRVIAFKKFIQTHTIDVVSSHLMAADTLTAFALFDYPHVVHCATMHGSYEGFPQAAIKKKREKVFSRVNGIIYLTAKNILFLNHLKNKNPNLKIRQIYNGYNPVIFESETSITRQFLSIKLDSFVFIQVARGARDKGWDEAIQAFLMINPSNNKPTNLILVGDGGYLSELKEEYKNYPQIIFYGYSGNPLPLISISDIGLLPTYYPGESLPNTIIEYMGSGKPVISSNIGEVKNMIGSDTNHPCGFALELCDNGHVNKADLAGKMKEYIENSDLYNRHVENTRIQSEKFKMENCANSYTDFFIELKTLQNKNKTVTEK